MNDCKLFLNKSVKRMFGTRHWVRLAHQRSRGFATFTIRDALEKQVERFPTRNALRVQHQDIRWTFAQLREHAQALGSGLLDLGVKPGEAVGVCLGNSAERVTVQLGAGNAGVKVVDMGNTITKEGLSKLLKEQKCKVLIVPPQAMNVVNETIPQLAGQVKYESKPLELEEYPDLKIVLQTGLNPIVGTFRFRDVLLYNSVPSRLDAVGSKDGDAAFLVDADGTSGKVRTELSQKQAMETSQKTSQELKLDAASRIMFKPNKDSSTKLAYGTLACVLNGCQLVVPSDVYDEKAIKVADKHDKCTAAIA